MKEKVINLKRILAIVLIAFVALFAVAITVVATMQADTAPAAEVVAVSAETSGTAEAVPAAETEAESDPVSGKALAAGIAIGLAAAAGAIGMGIAIAKSNEAISRQPEAGDKIRSNMMLGIIFIETAIICALVIAILIIFAL